MKLFTKTDPLRGKTIFVLRGLVQGFSQGGSCRASSCVGSCRASSCVGFVLRGLVQGFVLRGLVQRSRAKRAEIMQLDEMLRSIMQTIDAPHHTCHAAESSISPIPNPSERPRFSQTVGTESKNLSVNLGDEIVYKN